MAVKGAFPKKIKSVPSTVSGFFKNLGESGCFAIWMIGIFIVCALLWGLTSSFRAQNLAAQTNRALEASGERSRLAESLTLWGLGGTAAQTGSWFVTNDNKLAVIWNLPVDGVFSPFLTLFDDEIQIEKIVPLTITAQLFAERTSNGIPQVWLDRICRSALVIQGGR